MMRRFAIMCFVVPLSMIALCNTACAQVRPLASLFGARKTDHHAKMQAAADIPLAQIEPVTRRKMQTVIKSPTLFSEGKEESFLCRPNQYVWLLDNPDRTMVAWRRLGANCVEIQRRGKNVFGWSDDKGSDVAWRLVYRGPKQRIWFAEGKVKPSRLLPMIPVQCVVIVRHGIERQQKDVALMRQQIKVFVHTDSRAAKVAANLMGPAVPRMAKEAVEQMQMFFWGMSWYCYQHPQRVRTLLRPQEANERSNSKVLSPFANLQNKAQ